MPSWNTILDLGSLQYAPWRALTGVLVQIPTAEDVPYRPTQWKPNAPDAIEPTFINVINPEDGTYTKYFFDAIIRVEHVNARRITEHPVQTGANISDHSYQLPAHVTLEIGMSDVMDSYQTGQWDFGAQDKSVNAYRKLREIQDSGLPLSLSTRLDDYDNMVIENINSPDDFTTRYGLRAIVTFKQIITVTIAITKSSLNPNATNEIPKGAVTAIPPTPQEESILYNLVF